MNLAIITTLGVNAGDNFIYEGFRNIFPQTELRSTFLISKPTIPRTREYQRWVDASDLVVICGSPIFYHEHYKMHWQRKLLRYCEKQRKPMLLFAVGSNFDCAVDGTVQMPDEDDDRRYADFARRYQAVSWRPISVRDPHALAFLARLGVADVVSLACPSLFARPLREETDGDWIGIIWGQTFWRAPLSPDEVFRICRETQARLISHFPDKRVVWFCHDEESYRNLCKRVERRDVIYSNNYPDYFAHYARCAFALSTKVHGTMLLASLGIPSVLLQLDSRAATLHALDEQGLPLQTPAEQVAKRCVERWEDRLTFREKIRRVKEQTRAEHTHFLNDARTD